MKKIISSCLLFFGFTCGHAQTIQKTEWKSVLAEPINDTATLNIGNDTSTIANSKGREFVRSIFFVSHDTVIIKDIGGEISCGAETGAYTFTITGNLLKFMLITDRCEGRAKALDGRTWVKANPGQ